MSRAGEAGKSVIFDDLGCEFVNKAGETIAVGVREGCLYYLKSAVKSREGVYVTRADNKERLWHRRFGYLNEQSMQGGACRPARLQHISRNRDL